MLGYGLGKCITDGIGIQVLFLSKMCIVKTRYKDKQLVIIVKMENIYTYIEDTPISLNNMLRS